MNTVEYIHNEIFDKLIADNMKAKALYENLQVGFQSEYAADQWG